MHFSDDWGLYAMERIERGDLVIEYIGELIRCVNTVFAKQQTVD